MSGIIHLGALVAMVPAMFGPPHGEPDRLTLGLCGGAALTIELPHDDAPGPDGQSCAKGCHSGSSRKRIDRAQ